MARGRDVSQDADLIFGRAAWLVLGRVFLQFDRQDRRWWSQTGSNRRPPACKAGALPTELWPRSAVNQLMMPIFMKTAWLACRAVARGNQPAFALSGFGVAAFARGSERRLVGLGRFELPTSRLSSARSNQLSYRPNSKNFKPEHARSNPRVLKAIEAKDAPTTKG